MSALELENAFWTFSLALYPRPGVAAACLELQDRDKLDVNLLLLCAWLGSRGVALDAAALAEAEALVAAWRTEVVAPLRAVRRAMKLSPLLVEAPVGALRQAVAAQELAAEQLQQAMLHRWAMARWPLVTPGDAGLAGANLALLTAAPEVAVLSAP